MIGTLIEIITGPLGGALSAIVVVVGAWYAGKIKGASRERSRRQAEDAKTYIETIERTQDADLGHGATDSERVDRLREFGRK